MKVVRHSASSSAQSRGNQCQARLTELADMNGKSPLLTTLVERGWLPVRDPVKSLWLRLPAHLPRYYSRSPLNLVSFNFLTFPGQSGRFSLEAVPAVPGLSDRPLSSILPGQTLTEFLGILPSREIRVESGRISDFLMFPERSTDESHHSI